MIIALERFNDFRPVGENKVEVEFIFFGNRIFSNILLLPYFGIIFLVILVILELLVRFFSETRFL